VNYCREEEDFPGNINSYSKRRLIKLNLSGRLFERKLRGKIRCLIKIKAAKLKYNQGKIEKNMKSGCRRRIEMRVDRERDEGESLISRGGM
jgi:hypothetical protein